MRVFISYPYRPETEPFANSICAFVEALELEAIDGKWPDASIPLRDDIVGRIKNCEVLISLAFHGIPSAWADLELGAAVTLGLDVITITDEDAPRGGEHFHLSRKKGEWFLATALANTFRQIRQKRYASLSPSLSSNAPLDEYKSEAWPTEVLHSLSQLRALFAQSQFGQIEAKSKLASAKYPECWRFIITESAALIHRNKLDEADQRLDDVIGRFPTEPRALSYAYDNKGWSLSRRPGGANNKNVKARLRLHRRALQYEKRVEAYISLIECLLHLDRISDAESEFANCLDRFPGAVGAFRTRVRLEGKAFVQAVAKSHLLCAWLFPTQEVMVQ